MSNKVIIIGSLANAPEMRFTSKGDAVATFSIPTNKKYTDANGQKVEQTTWFRITAWRKQAETANEWFKKGTPLCVWGELSSDPATGGPKVYQKKDGSWGSSFEVTMSSFEFLPTPKTANQDTAVEDMEL